MRPCHAHLWQTRARRSVVHGKCVCVVFVLNTCEIAITHGQICVCPRIKNHVSVKLEVDYTIQVNIVYFNMENHIIIAAHVAINMALN